ncbi:unnamed protein product [Blepharisma stoltei]|uniref:Uncharacterized protein n=1 Tax=Blepharisma stoltei TaxID=1481888 RepID=A0AAU9IN98_9CILI|nr:unnamed protein product [Blepharisma stoltei]
MMTSKTNGIIAFIQKINSNNKAYNYKLFIQILYDQQKKINFWNADITSLYLINILHYLALLDKNHLFTSQFTDFYSQFNIIIKNCNKIYFYLLELIPKTPL